MDVARFNFSHGDHVGHKAVLDRVRQVAAAKGKSIAVMLDTKGPEIRTAMLKEGKNVELKQDQEVSHVISILPENTSGSSYVCSLRNPFEPERMIPSKLKNGSCTPLIKAQDLHILLTPMITTSFHLPLPVCLSTPGHPACGGLRLQDLGGVRG
jgi:hypothetical protein